MTHAEAIRHTGAGSIPHVVLRRQPLCPAAVGHEGSQGIQTTLPSAGHRTYDDSVAIIIRDGSGFNGTLERTLAYIANSLVQHDEASPTCRVTPDRRHDQPGGLPRQPSPSGQGRGRTQRYLNDVASAPSAGGTPRGGRWHPRHSRDSTAAVGGRGVAATQQLAPWARPVQGDGLRNHDDDVG